MNINERLKAAAQAIDELFADPAWARERYEQLMTALQSNEVPAASAIKVDSSAATTRQPAPARSAPVPVTKADLTERERKVIEVIRDSVQRRGYPPSMREIGQAVGLSSTSSVAHQLMSLERKGYLRRDPSRQRTYEIRGSAQASSRHGKDEAANKVLTPGGRKSGWKASDRPPTPVRETQPGEDDLKERVRTAWRCVEKLRRDSDEQGQYLHRKPVSNAEIAQHIGKSERTVSRWLRDQTFMPSRKEYLAIIEKLGGDPDEYDFIWHEGYVAYEALKGMTDKSPTSHDRQEGQQRLVPATDG